MNSTVRPAPREPFIPSIPTWDGTGNIDDYKLWRDREIRRQRTEWMRDMPMFKATDADGNPLYRLTETGNWKRTNPLPRRVRRIVLERDGHACTECGEVDFLEVDHIVRYIDGGSNDPSNLRTLCAPCHRKRGGQA